MNLSSKSIFGGSEYIHKYKVIIMIIGFIILQIMTLGYYNSQLNSKNEEIEFLTIQVDSYKEDNKVYKVTLEDMQQQQLDYNDRIQKISKDMEVMKTDLSVAQAEIDKYKLKLNVNLSKHIANQDLRIFEALTVKEMNDWINSIAPKDSPFRNRGDVFIEASNKSGLNPKYIFAHASVESGYGRASFIDRGNYFGIGAYNSNPDNAYTLVSNKTNDKLKDGIINGAIWIANNYTNKGQPTLNKMIYGDKKYAVYDDGSPNILWLNSISSIIVK